MIDVEVRVLKSEEKDVIENLLTKTFPSFNSFQECDDEHVFSIGAILPDGQIIGHILIHEIFDYLGMKNIWMLEYVVVEENYRKLGVAKKMIQMIEKLAIGKGISELCLTSRKFRIEARNLYTTCGFSVVDTGIFTKKLGERLL